MEVNERRRRRRGSSGVDVDVGDRGVKVMGVVKDVKVMGWNGDY